MYETDPLVALKKNSCHTITGYRQIVRYAFGVVPYKRKSSFGRQELNHLERRNKNMPQQHGKEDYLYKSLT